jgi:hypothetical protein
MSPIQARRRVRVWLAGIGDGGVDRQPSDRALSEQNASEPVVC